MAAGLSHAPVVRLANMMNIGSAARAVVGFSLLAAIVAAAPALAAPSRASAGRATQARIIAGAPAEVSPPEVTQLAAGVREAGKPVPKYPSSVWLAYRRAIADAAVAEPGEVVSNLLAISPANPLLAWREIEGEQYVLVSTMRRDALGAAGERVSLTNDRWVSIPAETAKRCRKAHCRRLSTRALDLRLKQLTGLPPDGDYTYINQFWVRPVDLFRPCTDPRTDTTSCPTQVPAAGVNPAVVGSTNIANFLWIQTDYAWHRPNRFKGSASFSCAVSWNSPKCYGVPWTRLGYTYDWKPGAKAEGISEFVAVKGASVVIESVKTQRETYPKR